MTKNAYILVGCFCAIVFLSSFLVMSYRDHAHMWTLDTLTGTDLIQSTLANQDGITDVNVAKDRGLIVVTYIEHNSMFRPEIDVPTVIKNAGGKDSRVVDHQRE